MKQPQRPSQNRLDHRTDRLLGGRTRDDRDVLESLPLGAFRLDAEGRILEFKPRFEDYDHRRWLGVVGENLFHDVLRATRLEHVAHTFRRGLLRRELQETSRLLLQVQGETVCIDLRLFFHDPTGQAWAVLDLVQLDRPLPRVALRAHRREAASPAELPSTA